MPNTTNTTPPLDFLNYFFFSFELSLNTVFIIIYPVYTYWCAKQKTLHINFRLLLQIVSFGHLVGALLRTILIVARIGWIGNENNQFSITLAYLLSFGWYLLSGGSVTLALERVYASFKAGSYEKSSSCFQMTLATLFGISPAVLITLLKLLGVHGVFYSILWVFDLTVNIITLTSLIYILRFNTQNYENRHLNDLQLTTRYQLSENIRATNYFLPVAIVDLIGEMITIGLSSYSIFFTDIPIGQDTSHLSHAYDMIFAMRRIFFGVWLLLKNEKFGQSCRKRKATVDVARGDQENNQYFEELKKQWEQC